MPTCKTTHRNDCWITRSAREADPEDKQQTAEWVKAFPDTNIPCSNDFSVTGDFGRPCEDKGLEQAGLPTDSFSIQNGIVIRNATTEAV
ncbi:unnamed protein product [Porites lobata]|uniref:Uncharacterized protein n=1 Tax=Porites lobata TaxID=104759 RepID=A0ABN8RPX1_9CNID|nr:unnamed protein product [Porites lobata]